MSSAAPDHLGRPPGPGVVLRVTGTGTAVLVPATAALALARHVGLRAARSLATPGPAATEDVVVVLAAVGLALLVLWWLVAAATALAAAGLAAASRPCAAVERASTRLAPAAVRRLVVAAVGVGVLAAAAPASASAPARLPAAAAPVADVPTATSPSTSAGAVAPPGGGEATGLLAVPSWPQEGTPWRATAPALAAPPPATAAPPLPSAEGSRGAEPDEHDVVVRLGDTLWSIAARALPAGTGASGVALEWPRWWAANRDVIGDDPDLLLPGQVLRAPVAGR